MPATEAGVPEIAKGLVLDGLALKLAVSVWGLPQLAGGAVVHGWPAVMPDGFWNQIGGPPKRRRS